MKKTVSIIILLAMLLGLAGCGGGVTIGSFSSKYFNTEDYDSAVQEVMTAFSEYEGCTLKKIGYVGDAAVKAEADARGLAPEQIIVLSSTFTTDDKDHGLVFEPNKTYEDYLWVLTRSSSTDPFWVVADRGYN
ncbi:MAG: hypothetical protein IJH48_07920 [Oscillospiraceae bacterium]|nr:hypothetical protein [Oscillospiraceae bacterium]